MIIRYSMIVYRFWKVLKLLSKNSKDYVNVLVNTMFKEFIFWLLVACCMIQIHGKEDKIRRFLKHSKLHQVQNLLNQMERNKKAMSCLCDMIKNNQRKYTKQGAAIYVRWGRTTCPGNGTELMYSGYAAGNRHDTSNMGGPSNFLCLPKNPDWAKYQDSEEKYSAKIYGTEYETHSHTVGEALDKSLGQYEVPCAVCQNTIRTGVYMLPGKATCFPGWQLEYRGYLMADYPTHSPSEFICVDAHPEHIGLKSNLNGRLLYPVEAACGSLKCPPYVNNRELTCSVCTR